MFAIFSCCFPKSSYTRVPECPVQSEKEDMASINAFSSRVISCVVATEKFVGQEGMKNSLLCDKGARICVVDKTDDCFIGFLENDPMKVLGAFPADMCQVDRAWLVEKFSKSSTSSDSDTEVESKIDRSEVIMKEPGAYSINSAKFVEIEV